MTNILRIASRGPIALAAVASASLFAVSGVQTTATAAPPPPAPQSYASNDEVRYPSAGASTAYTPRSAWNTVKYNRLYRTGRLAPSKCREPRYPLNSQRNILAWHRSFQYCLNNVWVHKVRAAKYRFRTPTVVVHNNNINTRCGPARDRAFYCSATAGIYISAPQYIRWYRQNPTWTRAWAAFTMGHEYGHHVQQLTGILPAQYYRQRYVLKTTAADLQENRRMELQASCMSAAYMGANRGYYPMRGELWRQFQWILKSSGDRPGYPRDHGSPSSHNYWTTRGWTYMSAYSCMTWSAGASVVD